MNYKHSLIVFLLVIAGSFNVYSQKGIKWVTIEEAQTLSKKEPRKVFVDTYTDWCGWCKVMDEKTFSNPDIIDYVNKNYYAIKLNAESRDSVAFNGYKLTKAQLAKSFQVSGYPTIVFVDETFQYVTPMSGYRGPDEFLQILKDFNQKK